MKKNLVLTMLLALNASAMHTSPKEDITWPTSDEQYVKILLGSLINKNTEEDDNSDDPLEENNNSKYPVNKQASKNPKNSRNIRDF